MKFENVPRMSKFELWLSEVPWRFERYYDLVPGMTDEDKKFLRAIFEVQFTAAEQAPRPL